MSSTDLNKVCEVCEALAAGLITIRTAQRRLERLGVQKEYINQACLTALGFKVAPKKSVVSISVKERKSA